MKPASRFAAFMCILALLVSAAILPLSPQLRAAAADEDWQGAPAVRGGSILYGVCGDVLIKIDQATGTGTKVGPLGIDIGNQGINFHPNGKLYGLFWNENHSDYRLYTINIETGAATEVGPLNLGLTMKGTDIAIYNDGRIFGIVGNQVIEINRFTGQGRIVYELPSAFDLPGLDFSPDGILWANGFTPNGLKLITIDINPPSYQEIVDLVRQYPGLCSDPTGQLYGSDNLNLWKISTAKPFEELVGPIGFNGVAGIDFSPEFKLEIIYSLPYARPGYLTWWKIALVNDGNLDAYVDRVRLDVYSDGTLFTSKYLWAGSLSIPAGQSNLYWINLTVGSQVQLGTYMVETVAEYQGDVKAMGSFEIEVID